MKFKTLSTVIPCPEEKKYTINLTDQKVMISKESRHEEGGDLGERH